jgi:hypothetical protein
VKGLTDTLRTRLYDCVYKLHLLLKELFKCNLTYI